MNPCSATIFERRGGLAPKFWLIIPRDLKAASSIEVGKQLIRPERAQASLASKKLSQTRDGENMHVSKNKSEPRRILLNGLS